MAGAGQNKARQGEAGKNESMSDEVRQDEARPDEARQDEARVFSVLPPRIVHPPRHKRAAARDGLQVGRAGAASKYYSKFLCTPKFDYNV